MAGRTVKAPPKSNEPLDRLFALAPDRYSFCIIEMLLTEKSVRYTKLQERFKMSSKTLATRLKQLVQLGAVERQAFNEMPPRVEYRLTANGVRLAKLLKAIAKWSSQYCPV